MPYARTSNKWALYHQELEMKNLIKSDDIKKKKWRERRTKDAQNKMQIRIQREQ